MHTLQQKFILFFVSLFVLANVAFALTPAVHAQTTNSQLKVENRDGVMYVTSENGSTTTTTVAQTTTTNGGSVQMFAGTPLSLPRGFFLTFSSLFNNILRIVMVIAALLVFVYLIWGGFEWITSGGEKGKTEAARNKIVSAIIGLIILAASYAILTLALNFIGYKDLNDLLNNVGSLNIDNTQNASSSSTLRQINVLK